MPVLALVLSRGARAIASDLDEAAAEAERSAATVRHERAVLAAVERARRLVHDHLLHALRVVAFERSSIPAEAAALEAQGALAALERFGARPEVGSGLLAEVRARAQEVHPTVTVLGDAPRLPAPVVEAFSAATRESLRNAGRHSGSADASVVVQSCGDEVRVVIADHGRGFDPQDVDMGRMGISSSIKGPMAKVGGRAVVWSRVGAGTSVVLSWRGGGLMPLHGPWGALPQSVHGSLVRSAILAVGTYSLMLAVPAVLLMDELPRPWLGWATLMLVVAGLLTAGGLAARNQMSRGWSLALLAAACAGAVGNIVSIDGADVSQTHVWMGGGMFVVLALPVLLRPLPEGVVMTAVATIVLGVAVQVHTKFASPWPGFTQALLAPPVGLGALMIVHLVLRRLSWRLEAEQGEIREQLTEAEERRHLALALDEVMAAHLPEATELLTSVASDPLQAADPMKQRSATHLEREVRDQLALWRWPNMRAALIAGRQTWNVTVRCAPNAPSDVVARAADLLTELSIMPVQPICDSRDDVLTSSVGPLRDRSPQDLLPSLTVTVRPRQDRTADGQDWVALAVCHPIRPSGIERIVEVAAGRGWEVSVLESAVTLHYEVASSAALAHEPSADTPR